MSDIAEIFDLAVHHHQSGRLAKAESLYRQVLQADPNHTHAHYNLGLALQSQGRLAEASASYRQAIRLNPNHVDAHNNLGVALKNQGRLAEAIAEYRQAIRINPLHAGAYNNLGTALYFSQGSLDDAVAAFQQALRLQPNNADAHNNLGNALKDQGRSAEAIDRFRRATQLEPQRMIYHSSLLFSLHCDPRVDASALYEEHRRWERDHALPLRPVAPSFTNDRNPDRRLRIGYVSPDFREHVLGRYVWPLLRHHDHTRFEVTFYAHLPHADAMTEKFRQCADHWRDVASWPDEQVAAQIRQDGIDILVDLAQHMGGNRLLIFARKPAPVQMTFAGYPGGTGISAIDYRLSDPYLDPPGLFDAYHAEATYRLAHSFWCYDPHTENPPIAPLPALAKGHITFGCLNNFCKVNDEVLKLWAGVLLAVPGSRLLLLSQEGSHRHRTRDFMAQQGVSADRIEFVSRKPPPEYLALYHGIDIGLDTFPYNGHTTSLDAFWMGVPVITMVGNTPVGRGGLSQLSNLGLAELAAQGSKEFVQIATDLAGDLPRLKDLRAGLRERMKASPLMDAAGYTRGIEGAYRNLWRQWCAKALV